MDVAAKDGIATSLRHTLHSMREKGIAKTRSLGETQKLCLKKHEISPLANKKNKDKNIVVTTVSLPKVVDICKTGRIWRAISRVDQFYVSGLQFRDDLVLRINAQETVNLKKKSNFIRPVGKSKCVI